MDFQTKTEYMSWENAHLRPIYALALTSTGSHAFTVSEDHDIKMWNINEKRLEDTWPQGHKAAIMCVAVSKSGKYLFTGAQDGLLNHWSISERSVIKSHNHRDNDECWIICCAVDNSDSFVFTGTNTGKMMQWSINDEELVHNFGEIIIVFLQSLNLVCN